MFAFIGNTVTMGAREAPYCSLSGIEVTLFGGVMSERHLGTVKWFNERKGYGFIAVSYTHLTLPTILLV